MMPFLKTPGSPILVESDSSMLLEPAASRDATSMVGTNKGKKQRQEFLQKFLSLLFKSF